MMKKKVLLVDDDADVVAQNKMFLESAGYFVESAGSAGEAEKKLDSFDPDIVVVDIMMEHPKAGVELVRKLTDPDNDKRYPVIFLTSYGANPELLDEPDYIWSKTVNVLSKPADPLKLLDEINGYFEFLMLQSDQVKG